MPSLTIQSELKLPCGATIKNRIAKSAMSENMGSSDHHANSLFKNLYARWAKGGAGLLITGNVMIDRTALGEANNVVIEKGHTDGSDAQLKAWAEAGKEMGTHHWVQLNHPGKQTPKFITETPVAPSSIPFQGPIGKFFNTPRELLESEIEEIIERFAFAAKVVKEAGFTGVQIHGAHGYLVSQFLSPLHNQRRDQWGGELENRMRFVIRVYQAIRTEVGPSFPIGIKLNSADFQRGGFTNEESIQVAETLSKLGMDLIEISGGTYEAPEMTGKRAKASTLAREAYFLDYCEKIRTRVKTPLLLTGGFRSLEGMNSALESGACDMIGLARSLAVNPEFPNQLFQSQSVKSTVEPLSTGSKYIDNLFPLEITWYTALLHRMGAGKDPKPNMSVWAAVIKTVVTIGALSLRRVRV